jgi:hypothetical protein
MPDPHTLPILLVQLVATLPTMPVVRLLMMLVRPRQQTMMPRTQPQQEQRIENGLDLQMKSNAEE